MVRRYRHGYIPSHPAVRVNLLKDLDSGQTRIDVCETEKNFRIRQYKAESETVFVWFPTMVIKQCGKSNFREREFLSAQFQAQPAVVGTPGQQAHILSALRSSEQGKQLLLASLSLPAQFRNS